MGGWNHQNCIKQLLKNRMKKKHEKGMNFIFYKNLVNKKFFQRKKCRGGEGKKIGTKKTTKKLRIFIFVIWWTKNRKIFFPCGWWGWEGEG